MSILTLTPTAADRRIARQIRLPKDLLFRAMLWTALRVDARDLLEFLSLRPRKLGPTASETARDAAWDVLGAARLHLLGLAAAAVKEVSESGEESVVVRAWRQPNMCSPHMQLLVVQGEVALDESDLIENTVETDVLGHLRIRDKSELLKEGLESDREDLCSVALGLIHLLVGLPRSAVRLWAQAYSWRSWGDADIEEVEAAKGTAGQSAGAG